MLLLITGVMMMMLLLLGLVCAGIGGSIAYMELFNHCLRDRKVPRLAMVIHTGVLTFLLSINPATDVSYIASQAYLWQYAPMVNLILLLYMMWHAGPTAFRQIVMNDYGLQDNISKIWEYMVKIVMPVLSVVILVYWSYFTITTDKDWSDFGGNSYVNSLVTYLAQLLLFTLGNALVRRCKPKRLTKVLEEVGSFNHIGYEETEGVVLEEGDVETVE